MKLLYVTDVLAVHGGMERVLVDKANWLSQQEGYQVCVITAHQGDHPLAFPLSPNVKYDDMKARFHRQYRYSGLKRWLYNRKCHSLFRERLREKIKEISPDVIICIRIDYLRDILKVKSSASVVFESHSSRLVCHFDGSGLFRKIRVWFQQQYVRKVQMVVTLTEGDAGEWRKLTSRVCVIPNVVRLNESETYCDCQSKSVVFVGRLCRQKDVLSLLQIWAMVNEQHPDWTLHIYGEGELEKDVQEIINKKSNHVYLHKPSSAIWDIYKKYSIFVLTSVFEPFGLVLPEAMSCGLPVVAFDCPYGPADIITDGKEGFLIKGRNNMEFANRICSLIENDQLRVRLGQAAIQSSKRYDQGLIMPQWKKLFGQLTGLYL